MKDIPCFECDTGILRESLQPYEAADGNGNPLVIPNVPILKCDCCDEELFSSYASKMIDDARAAAGVKFRSLPRRLDETGNPIDRSHT